MVDHSQHYQTPATWTQEYIASLPVSETQRYLAYALEHNNLEFARDLLKYKPNLSEYLKSNKPIGNSTPYDEPLFYYARTPEAIDLLLSYNVDIYQKNSNNKLAFIRILTDKNFKHAQLLCEKIPNIVLPGNTFFEEGKVSLFEAAVLCYPLYQTPFKIEKEVIDLLGLLIKKGHDINSHFSGGGTALSFTARLTAQHTPIIDFLLENGASPHISGRRFLGNKVANHIYPITMAAESYNTPFLEKVLAYYHTKEDFQKFEEQVDIGSSGLNLITSGDKDLIKEFLNEQKIIYEKKYLEVAISNSVPQLNNLKNLNIPIKEKFKI